MENVRIDIIDDDPVVRLGIKKFLSETPSSYHVESYVSMEEYFDGQKSKVIPQLVLIDIGLPGMNGIEGIRKIKEIYPITEILMLTVFKDPDRIFKSLCAGASGYMLKGTPFEEIQKAIQDVLRGGSYMSPAIARKVIEYFKPPSTQPGSKLTPREIQIVQGLVDGLSYKLLADRLSISIDTIRFHIKNIYAKLEVNSKTEVISKSLKGEI